MTDQTHPAAQVTTPGPEVVLHFYRMTELAPIAGQPARPLHETATLARYGNTVVLTVPAVPPLSGSIASTVTEDDPGAVLANTLDALRCDGWLPEPWQVTDDLDTDQPPF